MTVPDRNYPRTQSYVSLFPRVPAHRGGVALFMEAVYIIADQAVESKAGGRQGYIHKPIPSDPSSLIRSYLPEFPETSPKQHL